jgi:stage IV sporulation protein FB
MLESYRIGRILGSEIRIHGLFLVLVAVMVGSSFLRDDTGLALWQALVYGTMFSMILLHEFGHALAARLFGIRTPRITLHVMGGIAELDGRPRGSLAEFTVAFAGPLVNLVLAVVLFLGGFWQGNKAPPHTFDGFMETLLLVNVALFIFNLIPAFPMDGGRILKALIQIVTGERIALTVSVVMGQVLAVGFIGYAVLHLQVLLGVVGFFLFLMAATEAGRHPLWMLGYQPGASRA